MTHPQTPAYRHNGQLISPAMFYSIACDPGRSVAVEACAGAGKTWMLVSRIVRALLDGVDAQTGQLRVQPHEILAITFTKRAASEMRQRLHQWLQEFASATPAQLLQALRERGILIPNDLKPTFYQPEQLSFLYKRILASGQQVQVRTFHSWFAALLRNAPVAVLQQLRLPLDYELLEDDAPAKALVWRRFYAALLAQAERHSDYEALVFDYGRAQTDKALQAALDKRTEFALADAHGLVQDAVQRFDEQYPELADLALPQDWLRLPRHWQTLLDAALVLGQASAKTFAAKGQELEMALTANDLAAVPKALLTEAGTARKFGEKIVGIAAVRQAQELVLRVQAAQLQHAAWLYQQRLTRLSRVLLEEFAELKRAHGWVDMNDVERAALTLLCDPVLSGWVQERLDARIKHLLIDEFQDTNPLQWQALKSWLSGYAGSGASAPSVFIVGDPKQSIYRFRRAEPQVFQAAKAFVRDGLQGALLSCDHTRRNACGVMAAVNAVMTEAQQSDGYQGFRPHTTASDQTGLVYQLPPILRDAAQRDAPASEQDSTDSTAGVWRDSLCTPRELPEETLRTLEARQAALWIAQQLERGALQPADVMVLARKRASLLPMLEELRRLHIPAQIGEKTNLIDCCEVQDLVALLDLLVSPEHDLSLARVLKSPLFGLDDAALVQLALAQQQEPRPWFDLLQESELLTRDGRPLAPYFVRWKGWLDALPPHDALQAIYTDGDVLARFACAAPAGQREAVLANLTALLHVSLQLGGGRFATPYALVRALKAGGVLAPAVVNPQAVRLLTVHGAKGLEAELVLLLDTDTPARAADTMGVLIDWPGEAAWPASFVFLASESQPPACALALLEAERLERQREELNAFYVAMTRARHTLAISSIVPHRATQGSWWRRLAPLALASAPGDRNDFGGSGGNRGSSLPTLLQDHDSRLPTLLQDQDSRALAPGQVPAGSAFLILELPVAQVQPALVATVTVALPTVAPSGTESRPGTTDAGADTDSASSRIGQAMHRLLEWGELSGQHSAAAAREFGLTPEQAGQAAAMAGRILQGAGAWVWDRAQLAWHGNEVELMHQDRLLRLDRLVQRKDDGHAGHWWVLDYKSSTSPQNQPELVVQLRDYRSAVQSMYPDAVVRCAFLTAQGALVEVAPDH